MALQFQVCQPNLTCIKKLSQNGFVVHSEIKLCFMRVTSDVPMQNRRKDSDLLPGEQIKFVIY